MAMVANSEPAEEKVCMNRVRQAVHIRNDRWAKPWNENAFLVPLPCRRKSSVVSEFLPLTPFRSRSAARASSTPPTPTMQRSSHVGVARFYDWSEDKDDSLSVSRLYREIAGGARASPPRSFSEKVRPKNNGTGSWPQNNTRVNPGRMFLRDKGMLTKGEREIIEGIYRNRGDLRRDGCRSEFYVRSHHDAWVVGKPGAVSNKPSTEIPREPQRGGLMEVTAPPHQGADTPRASGGGGSGGGGGGANTAQAQKHTCIMCMREQQLLQQLQQQKQEQQYKHNRPPQQQQPNKANARPINFNEAFKPRGEGEGRTAPPTTPDQGQSPTDGPPSAPTASVSPAKLLPRRQDAQSSELAAQSRGSPLDTSHSWETDSSDSDSRGSSSKRKVHVKVVLPTVASDPADDDIRACMLQGRPTLTREKHLTNSDLRAKKYKPPETISDEPKTEVSVDREKEEKEMTSPRKSVLPTHHITVLGVARNENGTLMNKD